MCWGGGGKVKRTVICKVSRQSGTNTDARRRRRGITFKRCQTKGAQEQESDSTKRRIKHTPPHRKVLAVVVAGKLGEHESDHRQVKDGGQQPSRRPQNDNQPLRRCCNHINQRQKGVVKITGRVGTGKKKKKKKNTGCAAVVKQRPNGKDGDRVDAYCGKKYVKQNEIHALRKGRRRELPCFVSAW